MTADVEVTSSVPARAADVLTQEAIAFVASLEREFRGARGALLAARDERQARIDAGEMPAFAEPRGAHDVAWRAPTAPADLADRRVEITGPTDRKMMINALNSGASVFMADLEDANAPTWSNMVDGQGNLADAVRGTIAFEGPDGRSYRLGDRVATLVVRPRGWHLTERHVLVDGRPVSASLFDFGMAFFHNARALLDRGSGPYYYLPKLEAASEARLWNDAFEAAQDALGIPRGTIRATVLIETILAAFEMDAILFELREHASGLNAGRWDYIFSLIKKFRAREGSVLPDRAQVTMTVPFMRAYTDLLVRTCHARGAHAMGGMAAYIPSRRDPEANDRALERVADDKRREAGDGFDGTWVAHPDLVPTAMAEFDAVLGRRSNQLDRLRDDVVVTADQLLDVTVPGGSITDAGVRANVEVGIRYLASWLTGQGAAAINDLMEDAATAEIARSQIWQWTHHRDEISDGERFRPAAVRAVVEDVRDVLRTGLGEPAFVSGRFPEAIDLFERVALGDPYVEFLTLPGGDLLD